MTRGLRVVQLLSVYPVGIFQVEGVRLGVFAFLVPYLREQGCRLFFQGVVFLLILGFVLLLFAFFPRLFEFDLDRVVVKVYLLLYELLVFLDTIKISLKLRKFTWFD